MNMTNHADVWNEYSEMLFVESVEEFYRFNNECPSCGGCGDHGTDEEGRMYVCYGCGGTGKYHSSAA